MWEDRHAVRAAGVAVGGVLRTIVGVAVEAGDGLEAVGAVVVLQLVQRVLQIADLVYETDSSGDTLNGTAWVSTAG